MAEAALLDRAGGSGRRRVRSALLVAGSVLAVAGVLVLAWTVVVWRWQDPFTAAYTTWEQRTLATQLRHELSRYRGWPRPIVEPAAEQRRVAADAARFRRSAQTGQAIGRIVVPRLGLNMVLVDGTDESSLKRGPGRDERTYMPGQNRLVYIAGHRTTYRAPFSHIDAIRPGDPIRIEMPYATFVYHAVRHVIVPADDLAVLRSPAHEVVALQACNPRFFATQRYIVYGRLVAVLPRDGPRYTVGVSGAPS